MVKYRLLIFAFGLLAGVGNSANGGITVTNPGFEGGNTAGWTTGGTGSANASGSLAKTSFPPGSQFWTPTEGSFFGALQVGVGQTASLSQAFTIDEAGTVAFDWFFDSNENVGATGLDQLVIQIFNGGGDLLNVSANSGLNLGDTGWTTDSVALAAGTYTILATLSDNGDADPTTFGAATPQAGIDGLRFTAAPPPPPGVPEPASMSLLGLASLGFFARRMVKSRRKE